MRMRRNEGFVMIQVLILIMMILLFLTSVFSTSRYRHRTALLRIQKEEAKYAAESALELMENDIANGNTEWIENGRKKTQTTLEFESEDGRAKVSIPVVIRVNVEHDKLHLFAEAEVGSRKETAHSVLELPRSCDLMTDSNGSLATSSTATQSEGKEQVPE